MLPIKNRKDTNSILPNLLEIQKNSFFWFLEKGLPREIDCFSDIKDLNGVLDLSLATNRYYLKPPIQSYADAKRTASTYSVQVFVRAHLRYLLDSTSQEVDVLLATIPLMTNNGTFLINGIERVIINQLVRSPGIYYKTEYNQQKVKISTATLIPNRGLWIKFEIDKRELIYVKIGKAEKLPVYYFLRALGLDNLEIFSLLGNYALPFLLGDDSNSLNSNITRKESLLELFKKLRPDELVTPNKVESLIYSYLFDKKLYDLGTVGRYQINKRLGLHIDKDLLRITAKDLFSIIKTLINFRIKNLPNDDIDHLSNRRIKSIGEYLSEQVRVGLGRLEKVISKRMALCEHSCIEPRTLMTSQPVTWAVQEFFNMNPLSQFMDQVNPLAEFTQKRRLSLLGPGGISLEKATIAVRDIHPTQYGRICPIETPEGSNAGLIGSFTMYSKLNAYGFIETPYYPVSVGHFDNTLPPIYLDAKTEDRYYLAPGDLAVTEKGLIKDNFVTVRYNQKFINVPSTKVDFIAVSPVQIVSLATTLIPFFEHNDANRVLMGSNMQRQSVPLLYPEAPIVGTGFESLASQDSGLTTLSNVKGKTIQVISKSIVLKTSCSSILKSSLLKYQRSNQDTCVDQKPSPFPNEKIQAGQVLADGPSTDNGEIALGQNLLLAYMPWEGYNYEDAFVISERLISDNLFTSIHIEKFELSLRQTKFGNEEITRDIPFITDEHLSNLDPEGVIRVGSWVEPNAILVGKVTTRFQDRVSPEQKLISAILLEKENVLKDTSLRVPKGTSGRVLDIKVLSSENTDSLPSGVLKVIKIYISKIRKIQKGDKMSGRHGNKGIISKILPRQDMPYLTDGTPVDILLNPLGVPSRMNLGQLFESILGFSSKELNRRFKIVPFDEMYGLEASRALLNNTWKKASQKNPRIFSSKNPGKVALRNGQTGQNFDNEITVGCGYMLKLVHLVENKIHARSTGPYSAITQQPIGGRMRKGGQRFGEMEVWALEAFGAAYTLQELLTIKSDDMAGRNKSFYAIVNGKQIPTPSTPESFKVLICELQALCLDISMYKITGKDLKLVTVNI